MSQRSKREMVESIRPRYLKADKEGKKIILDEFVATTCCHRKHAIRLLKHGYKPKGMHKPGRPEAVWRSGDQRLGKDLGDLWTHLFQTVKTLFA